MIIIIVIIIIIINIIAVVAVVTVTCVNCSIKIVWDRLDKPSDDCNAILKHVQNTHANMIFRTMHAPRRV